MSGPRTGRFCPLPQNTARLLGLALTRLGLSACPHDRLRRVARTIALAAADAIAVEHVAEAIQSRALDRARRGPVDGLPPPADVRGWRRLQILTPGGPR
jgi:predicted ATPase with chaperone activity